MKKTARDVMMPATGWPADELADGLTGRVDELRGQHSPAGVGLPQAIGADDWVDQALATMSELKVSRLPVVDHGRLVGTVTQGDLASSIERSETWGWLCT